MTADPLGELSRAIFEKIKSDQGPDAIGAGIQQRMQVPIGTWMDLSQSGVLKWTYSETVAMERQMGVKERGVIHGALGQFPWEELAAEIDLRVAKSPTSVSVRAHALGVLGALAPSSEFDRLPKAAEVAGRIPRALQDAFQGAVSGYFARFPREAASLRDRIVQMPLALVPPLLAATVERGDHHGLKGLAAALGAIPEADPLIALSAGRIALACPKPVPEDAVVPLRRALQSTDGSVRVEGVKALGNLDDVGSLPGLIECLRDPELRVRKAAHGALEVLSRERHPLSHDVWSQWHTGAIAWRKDRLPSLLTEIKTGDTKRVSRALLELARYRVYRHVIVEGVIECSRTSNEHVGVVAASALSHFGTQAAARRLVELMEHRSLEVKRAAYAGLRRVTGENHGEDIVAWREAVGGTEK